MTAARAVFALHGVNASLDDVARRAGVGVGTLYRRFPTRDSLIRAVFDHVVAEIISIIDRCAADPDPLAGLLELVTDVVQRQSGDRGLFEICTKEDFGQLDVISAHYVPAVDSLVARGQAAGVVRGDLRGTDIGPMIVMLVTVCAATRAADPELWRRHLMILFDGIRVGGAELPASGVTHADLFAAIAGSKV